MSLWVTLFQALPEILKLLQAMQKHIDEAEGDRKVKEDLKKIREAFSEKDPAKLNALFNSD